MLKKSNPYLFVYGTLLSECQNQMSTLLWTNSVPCGCGFIYGKLYDLGDYPGAIADYRYQNKVFGRLVQLQRANWTLKILDDYEGIESHVPDSGLFRREMVNVFLEEDVVPSWIYVYNRPLNGKSEIPSGDYMDYLKNRT